jgi:TRAP-type mannitol/chloroaromatic compound transport system substrate-binding protein
MVDAARKQAIDVLGEMAARDAVSAKIHKSYIDFRARTAPWSRVSIEAVLGAREA